MSLGLWDLRFSQWWCWGFKPTEVWCRVVMWVVPCFKGLYCCSSSLWGLTPEDAGRTFLQNIGNCSPKDTASPSSSYPHFKITLVVKTRKQLLPVKIQGDSYSFDIAESEYDNQIALSPTSVKGERNKLKNYICNKKKVMYWFLLTVFSRTVACYFSHLVSPL